jgi:SAM-dependent methyltransferase
MAYNVLEHIPQGAPFFRRVAEVLRPGGSFWALTPHSQHPFAWLSNTVRWLNVKRLYRRSVKAEGVNAYASYYRLNSPRAILKQLDPTLFESVTFYRLPCTQWDRYFPAATRFIPHLYDRAIGQRVGSLMLLLAVQLVKKS